MLNTAGTAPAAAGAPIALRRIANARLAPAGPRGPADPVGLVDLVLDGPRIRAVVPAASPPGPGTEPTQDGDCAPVLDVGGALVCAGFVDAHVHLDKAFLGAFADPGPGEDPGLADVHAAIRAVDALRAGVDVPTLERHGRAALARLRRHGVVAARAHAEVTPGAGLSLVELQLGLAAEADLGPALQLVAFPQLGLDPPGAAALLADAMAAGCAVVGGCPYVDADPAAHLDAVFALAERHGRDIDLHLDFTDDATRSQLHLVVERTRAHGMGGHVTVGHCTTLAAMSPDDQRAALDAMAEAGVALVVMPATDLFLGGHGEPGRRSLAPVERAVEAGVRTAITNNNLANPFAPLGNGNLLQAAWLVALTRRVAPWWRRAALLEAITTVPAALLGLPPHGPHPGAVADLAVLDAGDAPQDLLAACPTVLATVQAGRLTYRTVSPVLR